MAQQQQAQIRIVKKKKGHAAHHGGAWKVAYADFVTAMMAFFLVMWIVGLSSNLKQAVSEYFKDPVAFNKAIAEKKATAPFDVADGSGVGTNENNTPSFGENSNQTSSGSNANIESEKAKLAVAKQALEQIIEKTPEFKDLKSFIDIKLSAEGLEIDLVEGKKSLFFDSGSAKVKQATQDLLSKIASELSKMDNNIMIEGHTDNRPLNQGANYTNWELSSDRANSARRIMERHLRPKQVSQVRGYAATKLRDPKHPESFANRRVSIIVAMPETQQSESSIQPSESIKPNIKTNESENIEIKSSKPKGNIMPDISPGINTSAAVNIKPEKPKSVKKNKAKAQTTQPAQEPQNSDSFAPIDTNMIKIPKGWKVVK